MPVDGAELTSAVELARRNVPRFTSGILYVPKGAAAPNHFGGGSCVYVDVGGDRKRAITCQHVTGRASQVYVGLPTQAGPIPISQKVMQMGPSKILAEDTTNDLAVVDASAVDFAAIAREPYMLSESDWITPELLGAHAGALSFMCGAWGEKTEMVSLGEAVKFVSTPLYFAGGPIKSVDNTSVVASFNERRLLFKDDTGFPQLADVQINGKSRDLSGTSGSGLWIIRKDRIHLAGILRGPASGVVGDPDIRFTPVWLLRQLLKAG